MKKSLVALSFSGVLLLTACVPSKATTDETQNAASSSSSVAAPRSTASSTKSSVAAMKSSAPSAPSAARVIEMTVSDWEFSQTSITAKKGEKVTIRLTNTSGVHSFMSNDLGINVALKPGETKEFPLPTDKTGSFTFRCGIPCGPGHKDMKGTVTVS